MATLYLAIAASFLASCLAVYSLFRTRHSPATYALSAGFFGAALLEVFDSFAVLHPDSFIVWKRLALFIESLLPFCWLLYSMKFSRQDEPKSLGKFHWVLLGIALSLPLFPVFFNMSDLFYSPDFATEHMLFLGKPGYVFYVVVLVLFVSCLINLEATLRAALRFDRWKIKFEILGVGGLLALDVIYYSQGLLYRAINMSFTPARSLLTICAVLCVFISRLTRGEGVSLYVSRKIAFRSVVLVVVGLYLLVLGLLGEGMRYLSETTFRSLSLASAVVLGMVLVLFLLSETLQRKLKVFLHKNFYANKYDYRTQWLQFTDRLSAAHSAAEVQEAILSGFSETFGVSRAALFLYDPSKQGYVCAARYDYDPIDLVVSSFSSLIGYMQRKQWVVNSMENMEEFDATARDFLATHCISFLVPLLRHGDLNGFIALGVPFDKDEVYNYEDYDLMKTLARQAASAILNLSLADQLAQARQMEAVGRVATFVIHDLKNLGSTIALIVDNAQEHLDNPAFQHDMLRSLKACSARMSLLVSRLKELGESEPLRREIVDLSLLVQNVLALINSRGIIFKGSQAMAFVDSTEIQKVVINLVLNALDACQGSGEVTVAVEMDSTVPVIRVADTGCGMSEEFRKEHLFRPFRTTKQKGLGIGLYQCRQIVEAHGGRIDVESDTGSGSLFTVRLPPIEILS